MKATISSLMVAGLLAHGVVGAGEATTAPVALRLPVQPLRDALNAVANQTGLQVIYTADEVRADLTAPRLEGTFTAEDALNVLLANSGLTFEFLNARTVMVTPQRSGKAAAGDAQTRRSQRADVESNYALRLARAQVVPGASASAAGATERSPKTGGGASGVRAAPGTEEVIVTAQKRSERLDDVPISISVLSNEALDRSTGEGVNEVLATVPGVKLTEDLWNGTQVSIRGVSASGPVVSGGSPVAYYLDSTPFGFVRSAIGPDANAYDLERVEVLRGPQGTLYGASALNGVVRVLTREADLNNFGLKLRTQMASIDGGDQNYRGDLAVNMPIIEGKLAVRAVVGYADFGGWIDRGDRADVNDSKLRNTRLRVDAQPTDNLKIGFTSWFSRTDRDSPTLGDADDQYPGTVGDTPTAADYDVFGLKVSYDFPSFSVSSSTSYIDYTNHAVFDYSFVGLPMLSTVADSKVLAEEVLLNSTGSGVWRWTAGAFYRDAEDGWYQQHELFFNPFIQSTDSSESFAVFGELTRLFMDGALELTGGLRYFEDRVSQRSGGGLAGVDNVTSTFDNVSPRVVLTWHPSDTLNAYVSYAEGFRSGFNQSPAALQLAPQLLPTKEDKLQNYELGLKGSLLDRRVSYEAAVYYIDWQDVQQQVDIFIPGSDESAVVTGVVNGSSASGPGIDVAFSVRPVAGLELSANASWNDLTLDADVYSGSALLLERGDRLLLSAEYSIGGAISYTFPLGASGLTSAFSASGNYGSQVFRPRDLTSTGISRQRPGGDPSKSYRAGLRVESDRRWAVDLFVDNLSNYRGTFYESAGYPYLSWRPRPRTIGLQFEYFYGM